MTLQSAQTHFSATHRAGEGDMHGHTWRVRAYWEYNGQCIVNQRTKLIRWVKQLDHSVLPDDLCRAEKIAEWIGEKTGAVRVTVWREAEGLGAVWPA